MTSPINCHPALVFPWNVKGRARDHVLAFLALAVTEAPRVHANVNDLAAAGRTLAWLRQLADTRRDQLP
jgi:hypothetical protein